MRSAFLTIRITGLLICALFLNAKAEVNPETVTASVKNVSVLEVFDIIRKQTLYSIFYDKEMLEGAKRVSLNVKDTPLADFLTLVSKDQPFTFYIEQQTIFIKKKVAIAQAAPAPTINIPPPPPPITGTITDGDGNPLAGVNILIKGTTRGTATDDNGRFSINAERGQILEISSVGFISTELTVGSQNVYSIRLAGEN